MRIPREFPARKWRFLGIPMQGRYIRVTGEILPTGVLFYLQGAYFYCVVINK